MSSHRNRVLKCGLVTVVFLVGGMMMGIFTGVLVHDLPMHVSDISRSALASIPTISFLLVGGAMWGWIVDRIVLSNEVSRMTWLGALGFGPTVIIIAVLLTFLEITLVENNKGPYLPIHVIFTILFVPATFIVASVGGLSLGVAQRNMKLAVKLFFSCGVAAGAAFLTIDLLMDGLGWRVGSPGAAARVTMISVTFLGSLAAAFAEGTALGYLLLTSRRESEK